MKTNRFKHLILLLTLCSLGMIQTIEAKAKPEVPIIYPDNAWFVNYTAVREKRNKASIDFNLYNNNIEHPDSGSIIYEVLIQTEEGHKLSPKSLRLTNYLGKRVKPLCTYKSKSSRHWAGAFYNLVPGEYNLTFKIPRVSKRKTSPHHYEVKLALAGDVDGDNDVDEDDLQKVQAQLDTTVGSSGNVLDVNRDGIIDEDDLTIVESNQNATVKGVAVNIDNQSGKEIYAGLYLPLTSGSTVTYQYWDFTDNSAKALKGKDDLPMYKLSSGSNTFTLPYQYYNSGRFVFSQGSAVSSTVNADGSITFPDQNTETTIFDFVEFTLKPSSSNNLNINTTIVDQFGFPITLALTPADIGNPNGVGVDTNRTKAITDFHTNEQDSPYKLCIDEATTTDTFKADNVTRILAPQHVLQIGDSDLSKDDKTKYNDLNSYFDSTIESSFSSLKDDNEFALFFARSFLKESSSSTSSSNLTAAAKSIKATKSNTAIVYVLNSSNPIASIGVGWKVASPSSFAGASVVAYDGTNSTATSFTIESDNAIPHLWMDSMSFSADGALSGAKTFTKCVVDNGLTFSDTSSATLLDSKTIQDLIDDGFGFGGGRLHYTWIDGAGIDFLRVGDQQIGSNGFTITAPTEIASATNQTIDIYLIKNPPGDKSTATSWKVDIEEPEPDFYKYTGKVLDDYHIQKTYDKDQATISVTYTYTATVTLPDGAQSNLQTGMYVSSSTTNLPADAHIKEWLTSTTGTLESRTGAFPKATNIPLTFSLDKDKSNPIGPYTCSISDPKKSSEASYKFTLTGDATTDGLYTGMKGSDSSSLVKGAEVTKVIDELTFYIKPDGTDIKPGSLSEKVTFEWQKSAGTPETYTVLQFTGTNGKQKDVTYQIFQPFFSTNKGDSYPIPPPWLPGVTESASQMVFGCDGVFADNGKLGSQSVDIGGQYPNNDSKNIVLGNLENQVVSALNRGHLPRKISGISGTFGAVSETTIDDTKYYKSTVTITSGQASLASLHQNMAVRGTTLPETGLRLNSIDTSNSTLEVISRTEFSAPEQAEALTFEVLFVSGLASITATSGTTAPYTGTMVLETGFDSSDLFPGMAILGAGITGAMTINKVIDSQTLEVTAPGQIGKTGSIGLSFAEFFPDNSIWNRYAEYWGTISIDGKSYSFPFSDQGGYSSDTSVDNPTDLTITLEKWTDN